MNNFVKITLLVGLTALCVLIGYLGTAFVQDMIEHRSVEAVIPAMSAQDSKPRTGNGNLNRIKRMSEGSRPSDDGTADFSERQPDNGIREGVETSSADDGISDIPESQPVKVNEPYLEISSVSKPVYHEEHNKYSFTVVVDGIADEYHLCDIHGNELFSQSSPDFVVDPSYSGKYLVYVSNSRTSSSQTEITGCYRMVEKLSKSEIQAAFNSGDYQKGDQNSFKTRISSKCSYHFSGIRDGEDAPVSYNEIFNRISMGVWSSVEVNSIAYDARNRVSNLSITVNY